MYQAASQQPGLNRALMIGLFLNEQLIPPHSCHQIEGVQEPKLGPPWQAIIDLGQRKPRQAVGPACLLATFLRLPRFVPSGWLQSTSSYFQQIHMLHLHSCPASPAQVPQPNTTISMWWPEYVKPRAIPVLVRCTSMKRNARCGSWCFDCHCRYGCLMPARTALASQ